VILYAILLNRNLQRWLSASLSQWLGKVSFSLYLVHIIVICSFSSWLYLKWGGGVKVEGLGVAVVAIATMAFSLLAAVVFYGIERMGIVAGRRISRAVLNRAVKTPVDPAVA
jgi:peptidoglycan/LPS O-acetylase OafA/YrhL